jgi:hypothetical protein
MRLGLRDAHDPARHGVRVRGPYPRSIGGMVPLGAKPSRYTALDNDFAYLEASL